MNSLECPSCNSAMIQFCAESWILALVKILSRADRMKLLELINQKYPSVLVIDMELLELIAKKVGFFTGSQSCDMVGLPMTFAIKSWVPKFMENKPSWTVGSSDLFQELEYLAESHLIDKKTKSWPKAPQVLVGRLNEIKTKLQEEVYPSRKKEPIINGVLFLKNYEKCGPFKSSDIATISQVNAHGLLKIKAAEIVNMGMQT